MRTLPIVALYFCCSCSTFVNLLLSLLVVMLSFSSSSNTSIESSGRLTMLKEKRTSSSN